MNNPFEDLMYRSGLTAQGCWDNLDDYDKQAVHKFAELIVRECADWVRTNYDSRNAEPLAFNMEKDFGLHGDYAE